MKKERPILFSTLMVQAILQGRKSQTRRIVKPQPDENGMSYMANAPLDWNYERDGEWKPWFFDTDEGERYAIHCPYGNPGDILWVRETFSLSNDINGNFNHFNYKADNDPLNSIVKWKPSLFMPRAACRLRLEIINIKVERLQDISEEDAKAEGVETLGLYPGYDISYRGKFEGLWNSINGNESWEMNPWVWVIEFKTN